MAKKITVWHDTTSQKHGWIVDECDEHGDSKTLQVFDDQDHAVEWARHWADEHGLELQIGCPPEPLLSMREADELIANQDRDQAKRERRWDAMRI